MRDVNKRAEVDEILRHPWLEKHINGKSGEGILSEIFVVDNLICRLAAFKLKEEPEKLQSMLENNEHNKHTTLYYLLVQKHFRGELELYKELEEFAEVEMKRERSRKRREVRSNSREEISVGLTLPNVKSKNLFDKPVENNNAAYKFDREQLERAKQQERNQERHRTREHESEVARQREDEQQREESIESEKILARHKRREEEYSMLRRSVNKNEPITSNNYATRTGTSSREGSRPEKTILEEPKGGASRHVMPLNLLQYSKPQSSHSRKMTQTPKQRSGKKPQLAANVHLGVKM